MAEHMLSNKSENGITGVCEYVSIGRKTRTWTGIDLSSIEKNIREYNKCMHSPSRFNKV